jgi:hypothetical protein
MMLCKSQCLKAGNPCPFDGFPLRTPSGCENIHG